MQGIVEGIGMEWDAGGLEWGLVRVHGVVSVTRTDVGGSNEKRGWESEDGR